MDPPQRKGGDTQEIVPLPWELSCVRHSYIVRVCAACGIFTCPVWLDEHSSLACPTQLAVLSLVVLGRIEARHASRVFGRATALVRNAPVEKLGLPRPNFGVHNTAHSPSIAHRSPAVSSGPESVCIACPVERMGPKRVGVGQPPPPPPLATAERQKPLEWKRSKYIGLIFLSSFTCGHITLGHRFPSEQRS